MFCDKCGRELKESKCSCIHSSQLNDKFVFLLFPILMMVPGLMMILQTKIDILDMSVLFMYNVSIILVVVGLTISTFILKKPYLAIFFGCHQMTSRSIKIKSYVFPLCNRCLGIYLGLFGSLFMTSYISFGSWYVLLFALPLIIDGTLQKRTTYISNTYLRLSTGFLFGIVLIYAYAVVGTIFYYVGELLISLFV